MQSNALFTALPDLSARIMRQTLANALNVNWDLFCRDSRLKPVRLDDCESEVLAQDELLLQQGFAALTIHHPYLWFDVGLRYRSIKYGALGLAMMTARTLGDGLKIACRYQALTYSLIAYRYASAPNGSCALLGDRGGLSGDLHDFTQHRDLGAIRTLIADLAPGQTVLERVTVAAPPPCNWAAIKHHFTCPVEFHADQTRWIFLPGAANQPLPLGDDELLTLYTSRCEKLIGEGPGELAISHRLATLLALRGPASISAGEAAKQLALSERTLHRRLADEGTRFSSLVDEARYRRARALLHDRRLTIEAIASAVGFAETSSFSRAFKRWSGMGALEFRRCGTAMGAGDQPATLS